MLPAFKGRINRKTFILGNLVGLSILGFAALIYIVPIAIIDLIIGALTSANASVIFKLLYGLFIIPAIFYFFFFCVLFVKRLHDIGYPGMLILWTFIISQLLAQLLGIQILSLISVAILIGVASLPGKKERNPFGPKPHKKFKLKDIIVKF